MHPKMFRLASRSVLVSFAAAACSLAPSLRADTQLTLSTLGVPTQTGGSAVVRPPANAIDNNTSTYSETTDTTNSFWEIEMTRKVRISRVDLVAPSAAPNGL